MSERVRVSGPPRRRTRRTPAPRRRQIDEKTQVGEVYLRSLLREQLRLAVLALATLALGLGSLPTLFYLLPSLAEVRLLGAPLPWWLLGFGAYPFLLLLGRWYIRAAERTEADFVDLVDTVDRP